MLLFKVIDEVLELVSDLDSEKLSVGDAELFGFIATSDLAANIHIVVLNNSQDNVRSRDALGSLSRKELPGLLKGRVDIIFRWCFAGSLLHRCVWDIVMSNVVVVVLLDEVETVGPWGGAHESKMTSSTHLQ